MFFPMRWGQILAERVNAVNGKGVPFAQLGKSHGLVVLAPASSASFSQFDLTVSH